MASQKEIELKVGLFVTIGLSLVMLALLALGSAENFFTRQNNYLLRFTNVDGLIPGSKVVLAGIQVGTIKSIDFMGDISAAQPEDKKFIGVTITVAKKYAEWIRKDSVADVTTQGVLGDKFIMLSTGSPASPLLDAGAEIPVRPAKDIAQFLNKSDSLLVTLNNVAAGIDKLLRSFEHNRRSEQFFQGLASSAQNLSSASEKLNSELDGIKLKKAVNNLNSILEKINNGTGTLGALINDPALYDDTKALIGGANRNRIMRNLVRKTIKDNEDEAAAEATAEPASGAGKPVRSAPTPKP